MNLGLYFLTLSEVRGREPKANVVRGSRNEVESGSEGLVKGDIL